MFKVLRTPSDAPATDLEAREAELRALAAARKNWVPPEDERPVLVQLMLVLSIKFSEAFLFLI